MYSTEVVGKCDNVDIRLVEDVEKCNNMDMCLDVDNDEDMLQMNVGLTSTDANEVGIMKNKISKKWVPSLLLEKIPSKGMVFETDEDAHEFYRMYARMGGFDTKRSISSKKNGIVVSK